MLDSLGQERKVVALTFVFVFCTFLVTGVLMERTTQVTKYGSDRSFSGGVPVELVFANQVSSNPMKLKAEVKGSIYETGSNMTVFGACFDGNSYLLPDANATFTAWYPNGSVMIGPNGTMDRIYDDFNGYSPNGTGRWKIHVTMGSTVGTYLTEMRCEYQGEWAIALGEWQNPEWVQKIGDTFNGVVNISQQISNLSSQVSGYHNVTQTNISTVLNILGGINGSLSNGSSANTAEFAAMTTRLNEVVRQIRAIDANQWVLDERNPFYVLGSGVNNFRAVDMLTEYNVQAVGDGIVAYWDGLTWNLRANMSAYNWSGVSVAPGSLPYAWYAGTDGVNPVLSVNGALPFTPTLPNSSATIINDVKIFQEPNNPSGLYYGYLLGDDGALELSLNNGATWSYVANLGASSHGRISQVVENYRSGAPVSGYVVMAGQGSNVVVHDGAAVQSYSVSGDVQDVSLLYGDLGYVVVKDVADSKVYKYNGSALSLDYVINDSVMYPTGVAALAQNDVWVSTRDPSVFYHFDGVKWDYYQASLSQYVSIIISFGNFSSATGLYDVVMESPKSGYAVGDDGLVLKFERHYDDRLDLIQSQLLSINQSLSGQVAQVNNSLLSINQSLSQSVGNLTSIVLGMNSSLTNYSLNLQYSIDQMNATLNYKLDNIESNITYTNLYLNTTLYPLMNATYQNTILLLQWMGVLDAKLNQTIELQNQTLQIVNATDQKVDQLLNRSNRIRAWVTQ